MTVPTEWADRVSDIVGKEHILTDPHSLEPYSHDEFPQKKIARMPGMVILPGTEEEIAAIVRECHIHRVPLTIRGGGTGLSGGCVPLENGVVLSLKRLHSVITAHPSNRTITVQAGMTLHSLYQEVAKLNLFFPPHPGDSGAFVGGIVATNAGGARAVKYGTVKRFVNGIQVVLPDGSITEFGGERLKSSTGYHCMELFIGSEGTLGIITRVTLLLQPPPVYTMTLVAPFTTIHQAIATVPKIIASGIIPTAVEFIEHSVLKGVEKMLDRLWPTRQGIASLMFILDGKSENNVLENAEIISQILESNGACEVLIAEDKTKQEDLLEMRSAIYESLREGMAEVFDICVPVSEIANHIDFVHSLEKKYHCYLPSFGHAGDGNVHTHFLRVTFENGTFGKPIPEWEKLVVKVRNEIYSDAIGRGGVISGEHGIGLVKQDSLKEAIGAKEFQLMHTIKRAIDPLNILNPGKVLGD